MAEIKDLSTTDASNTGTAANAGFPENMPAANVNNAARALEGMIARWYADGNGTLTTGGSSNTYTLTPNRTISAYADGDTFLIEPNHSNTGAATLNVSSLGARNIYHGDATPLTGGEMASGGRYLVSYDGAQFILLNPTPRWREFVFSLDDDSIAIIGFSVTSARGIFIISGNIAGANQGMAGFRVTDNVFCSSFAGSSGFATTTGALTGTTGTDGNLTVSAHTDGSLYIENRTGGTKGYAVTFLSMQVGRPTDITL